MNKGRVLIVDDQEEILTSLHGILTDEGYEVSLARDGQEALHIFQSDSPDVVFLDIWIPGIDGMQALKAVKRIDPDCSVIMMSGHGSIETAVQALKLGAADYLEKPIDLDDVLRLLNTSMTARPASPRNHRGAARRQTVIGRSDSAERLRREIVDAAASDDSVWIWGAEGTGKEFIGRTIHYSSTSESSNLVKVRCADLSQDSFRETLPGRSDMPASQRLGNMRLSEDATLIFLRVDLLPDSLLRELLNALRLVRSGEVNGKAGRRRILCTSLLSPEDFAAMRGFDAESIRDLSERVIRVPSLQERAEDIPLYASAFLEEAAGEFDRELPELEPRAARRISEYAWPGNVKELKTLIEHAVMNASGRIIREADLMLPGRFDAAVPSKCEVDGDALARMNGIASRVSAAVEGADPVGLEGPGSSSAGLVRYQKTLRGRAVMYGQGLHSGVKTGLTISPLPPGSGILFGHITSGGAVPAIAPNVQSTNLSTCLVGGGTAARTIEHLMAVFHVYGLTNLLVKISAEVPIMDGSAIEFCKLVESAEIILQDAIAEEAVITRPLELPLPRDGGKSLRVEPADVFEVEYHLDYPPPVGSMRMTYRCDDPEDFKLNIAPARTFGFVKDMQMMSEMGLADGGRLSNVILLDDEKVVNPPLRFPDEFVRHKILDIIGDFYLLGRPFRGKVIARQTGHTENIAMVRLIDKEYGFL